MRAKLRRGLGDVRSGEVIDDALMAFDADFPFGLLYAFAKALKKDPQQVAECDRRRQSAGFQQRAVEFDVQFNPGLQIAGGPELIDQFLKSRSNRIVIGHAQRDMGERAGPAWAVVDGQSALGHVGGVFSIQVAMQKARQVGVAYVGLRNTGHIGAAG